MFGPLSNEVPDEITDYVIWSQIEQGLAISAGCLVTLRPLFQLVLQKLRIVVGSSQPRSGKKALGALPGDN